MQFLWAGTGRFSWAIPKWRELEGPHSELLALYYLPGSGRKEIKSRDNSRGSNVPEPICAGVLPEIPFSIDEPFQAPTTLESEKWLQDQHCENLGKVGWDLGKFRVHDHLVQLPTCFYCRWFLASSHLGHLSRHPDFRHLGLFLASVPISRRYNSYILTPFEFCRL